MAATNGQLTTIQLGDAPDAWSAAGFHVHDDGGTSTVRLGTTVLLLTGSGTPFEGWSLAGVDTPIDGLPTASPPRSVEPERGGDRALAPQNDGSAHPNGISRIDHVVVRTGDCDRTIGAFVDAGFEVRGGRSTTSYGAPMRQTFFWAGDVILELVGPDEGEPTTDEATSIFGLALVAQDLDATAAFLGPLMGTPKDAVQQGRRIAGLRGREVGIALPITVMSPHVKGVADPA